MTCQVIPATFQINISMITGSSIIQLHAVLAKPITGQTMILYTIWISRCLEEVAAAAQHPHLPVVCLCQQY